MTETAWPWVMELISTSPLDVQVLPGDLEDGRRSAAQLQVTEKSALGAIMLHSGGLLVDCGWLRILGGMVANGNCLAEVNRFPSEPDLGWSPEGGLVVAYDVIGGVFALNGIAPEADRRPGSPGEVIYFAPDSLEWEALRLTHSQWLSWVLSGRTGQFYESLRWPGWEHESRSLSVHQGIAVYPFLWSAQAHENLAATSRRAVPVAELLRMSTDYTTQAGLPSPGFLGSY